MGAPGGPRAKTQDGGVRVSVSVTRLSASSRLSDARVTPPLLPLPPLPPPQALIKRRLENRAKRSSSGPAGALGLSKGSRYVSEQVMLTAAKATAHQLHRYHTCDGR